MATSDVASNSISHHERPPDAIIDRILATIYGQCIGDAMGLLTEFLPKKEAKLYYGKVAKELEYYHKVIVSDGHRVRWKEGDWTDDSDQMILIMRSLVDCEGKVNPVDFATKLRGWISKGFPELGDFAGMGLGKTTSTVTKHPEYLQDPHKAAEYVWDQNLRQIAPNGAVMRTSFVGVHMYWSLDDVAKNARDFAKTTHYDPRCQASTVAVSVAIAIMLQGKDEFKDKKGHFKVKQIIKEAFNRASHCMETPDELKDLKFYLECEDIKKLKLDEPAKIGYTYKSMGSGFWALKQKDFRKAITEIVLQGGDADSNACVGGALLGCKLGLPALPDPWLSKLLHRNWLDAEIKKYFDMMKWEWKPTGTYQPQESQNQVTTQNKEGSQEQQATENKEEHQKQHATENKEEPQKQQSTEEKDQSQEHQSQEKEEQSKEEKEQTQEQQETENNEEHKKQVTTENKEET